MTITATFELKCRRCGVIHTGSTGSKKLVYVNIISLINNLEMNRIINTGVSETLLSIHECEDGGYGVSDLIGAKLDA
jgi:hypothetical protein